MLEIFGIMALCNINKKNAAARGEKPGKYIAFTILLWVGLEFFGALIGALAELGMGTYILAMIFAGIGGFISYIIAKGNGAQAAQPTQTAQPAAYQSPQAVAVNRAQLMSAARAVFNNSFSDMVFDPEDTLWKEPIQKELDLLVRGGADSVSVLEELLNLCAAGGGNSISDSWWYGSKWAVKAAAMLPRKEAAAMMVRLLQRDSNIVEWFSYVQSEAARQLGIVGGTDELPALQGILERPFSMSPVNEIVKAIEKVSGQTVQLSTQTPTVILHKAQDQLGDEDGIEFLLPLMEQVQTWEKNNASFYYYLLARKSERMGFVRASRAFYAAQVAARPDSATMGWQIFMKEGITPSPEAAARLHGQYPLPKTMEEIKEYGGGATPDFTSKQPDRAPDKKKKVLYLAVIAFTVILIAATGITLFFLIREPAADTAKLLEKGHSYLDDGEYEQALEQFIMIIDIDNKDTDAYIGAADAFSGLERTDRAIRILEKGYKNTESMRIKRMLDGLMESDELASDDSANVFEKPEAAAEDQSEYADPNGPGNTSGNVANGALAAVQGEWIFYVLNDGIHKVKADGTGESLLIEGSFSCLNVAGDWVYFMDGGKSGVYKARPDGTEKTPITREPVATICVDDGWVYYTNYLPNSEAMDWSEAGIFKIRADGSEKTQLSYDFSNIIVVEGDWLYYIDNNYAIYKIRTDGTERTQLDYGACGSINVAGDWVYYVDTDVNFTYKMRSDGTEKTLISSEFISSINVLGEWIYYSNFIFDFENFNDETGLFKMRLDGTEKTQLTNDMAFIPNIAGDWIHYLRFDNEYNLDYCKVRIDGTEQQMMSSAF